MREWWRWIRHYKERTWWLMKWVFWHTQTHTHTQRERREKAGSEGGERAKDKTCLVQITRSAVPSIINQISEHSLDSYKYPMPKWTHKLGPRYRQALEAGNISQWPLRQNYFKNCHLVNDNLSSSRGKFATLTWHPSPGQHIMPVSFAKTFSA